MLLEIRLTNFYSINEEISLDLCAANLKSKKTKGLSNRVFEVNGINLLKYVGIYGSNASGKTNIIKTIRFCCSLILDSGNHHQTSIFNFKPFKFLKEAKPSVFLIRFLIDEIEYEYSFSLLNNQIHTESLFYYPKGRRAKIFVREEELSSDKMKKYSFGKSISHPEEVVRNTSNKNLFITRASQMDREIGEKIHSFFASHLILNYQYRFTAQHIMSIFKEYKPYILEGMQAADIDITDIKVEVEKRPAKNFEMNLGHEPTVTVEGVQQEFLRIVTYHKGLAQDFDFNQEESLGTQKLFWILLRLYDILKNNKILIIDEIETSLHPKLVEYILELFNESEGAQLIFTTHNTNLLDLEKLRKDQVWFVNKKENGASDLYSLYDYNDFRDTLNLEKAYLQGRFNAVPIISWERPTVPKKNLA